MGSGWWSYPAALLYSPLCRGTQLRFHPGRASNRGVEMPQYVWEGGLHHRVPPLPELLSSPGSVSVWLPGVFTRSPGFLVFTRSHSMNGQSLRKCPIWPQEKRVEIHLWSPGREPCLTGACSSPQKKAYLISGWAWPSTVFWSQSPDPVRFGKDPWGSSHP